MEILVKLISVMILLVGSIGVGQALLARIVFDPGVTFFTKVLVLSIQAGLFIFGVIVSRQLIREVFEK